MCAQNIYRYYRHCIRITHYDAISNVACELNSGSASCVKVQKKEITLIAHKQTHFKMFYWVGFVHFIANQFLIQKQTWTFIITWYTDISHIILSLAPSTMVLIVSFRRWQTFNILLLCAHRATAHHSKIWYTHDILDDCVRALFVFIPHCAMVLQQKILSMMKLH